MESGTAIEGHKRQFLEFFESQVIYEDLHCFLSMIKDGFLEWS
jgi:hypothetical protein